MYEQNIIKGKISEIIRIKKNKPQFDLTPKS